MRINLSKNHLVASLIALTLNASAQKLPSEQKESLYAPANVKIDGKPTEWAGKFQARNTATLLTYVMANNGDNLYLIIQADNIHAIGKIFYSGISLVIKSRKDKQMTPLKITYPVVALADRTEIVFPIRDKTINNDTVAVIVNQRLGKSAKIIALSGFTDITEPDISVYNELGIKAAVSIDNTRTMTFEYCIPLKYIKNLLDENSSFDYSIIINGLEVKPGTIIVGGNSLNGDTPKSVDNGAAIGDQLSPTYLKATYTLIKK